MTAKAFPKVLTPLPESLYGERIVAPGESVESVARIVTDIVLAPRAGRRRWLIAAGACGALAAVCALVPRSAEQGALVAVASYEGWIGIAEGSLLVSAVLLLAGVEWRCAVGRITETVALLAAIAAGFCAGAPAAPWMDGIGLSPPFGSAASWQVAGTASLVVVCASHWLIGLLPDLAILHEPGASRFYGWLAGGWRGSALQWRLWEEAHRSTALLGALLAIALQVGASVMQAATAAPGRQDTLLPVTFLVDAVLSGVGASAAAVVVIRATHGLCGLITRRHLDILARLILVLGLSSLYCHATTILAVLLHGEAAARDTVARGFHGDLAPAFWTVVACGLLPPQLFWLPRLRRSGLAVAVVGTLVAVGAYADRAMGLAVTLRDASALVPPAADIAGIAALAGSVALFLTGLILVLQTLPIVSIAQMRALVLAHNPVGALTAPPPKIPDPGILSSAGVRFVAAEFASARTLAAAASVLRARDRSLRLDALGPVPIPEALEVLRPAVTPIRLTALAGALLGGCGVLAVCLTAIPLAAGAAPWGAWPSLVLPSLMAALTAGTLAALAALLAARGRRQPRDADVWQAGRSSFVLTARVGGEPGEAERIEQRLMALPAADGRPLTIRKVA
ncbi:quinol:electron acceptor oxidoreductase subunit ActD [Methylobacterium gnaphalii]|uniref:DUF3341 domain-containing protein n=1 Tax=Methylobacterium gnaphalii TaxID=1010610 RepID=A0A512JIC7_9HYPH|nr:quinol:electron acceptor oxidoreductase subunit ActD [Methylobacterium gnaphalii]GEP09632.1 hypothetical protein MGN01_14770 [Methylobacterium gnaphalii]GJD67780.1 hypothetical protein MMMDOFMJ_0697 [Methylobacterium gnaphalii]GLS48575.1 hypothetical protein GCM10007885_14190 [Methylobacterium gnaphalii]